MQLYVAEVPGPVPDKIHPKVKETAQRLWVIYIAMTAAQTLLLWLGEMDFFDALNHAFTTMSTGGFSTFNDSLFSSSAYTHYVVILFMVLAGANFAITYHAFHFRFDRVLRNEEFRAYLFIMLAFTLVIALVLVFQQGGGWERSFRDALFQVATLMTTTGFGSADYIQWGSFLTTACFVVMFFGGSAGSTSGGIKVMRILLLFKSGLVELKRLVHPNAVIPVRLDGKPVDTAIINRVLGFTVLYIFIFVFSSLAMTGTGLDFETAMGAVIASLGNIGPGIGQVGPTSNFAAITDFGKWFLAILMMVGRLELFTVLVLFSPAFWQK